jgi:hypothetical protein
MNLSKDALRLYVAVTRYADGRTRVARPGQLRLIEQLRWTYSGGQPDRRRLHKALAELEGADLVRRHGTHPLGGGRWVRCYLVAPFATDADAATASLAPTLSSDADKTTATTGRPTRDDAVVSANPMRSFLEGDAVAASAPSKQFSSNQFSSERESRSERDELDRIAVKLNMQSASYDELRAARDREAARAS